MSIITFKGAVYRRKAAVEVSYEAINDDAKFLVDMWLSKSGKKKGTPEYEEFKKKMIQRALQFGEKTTEMDKRVNIATTKKAEGYEDTPLDVLAEANLKASEAHHLAKELLEEIPQELKGKVSSIKNLTEDSVKWMVKLAPMLGWKG